MPKVAVEAEAEVAAEAEAGQTQVKQGLRQASKLVSKGLAIRKTCKVAGSLCFKCAPGKLVQESSVLGLAQVPLSMHPGKPCALSLEQEKMQVL